MRFYVGRSCIFRNLSSSFCASAVAGVTLCLSLYALTSAPGAAHAAPLSNLVQAEKLSPKLTELVGTLLGSAESIRGLPAKGIVRARSSSQQELVTYMDTQLDDPVAKRQLQLNQEILKVVGAVKADLDILTILRSFMVEQVTGFYDWKQKILYMADWIPENLQSFTLLHELTHALQDQHFGLERLLDATDGVSEPYAAAQALMEGDATLTTIFHSAGGAVDGAYLDFAVKTIVSGDSAMPGQDPGNVPPVISESLMFPYTDGLAFVVAAFRAGGGNWSVVNRLYSKLPLSTEQIIHPEKHLSEHPDFPKEVRVRGIADMVGSRTFAGTDIMGEGGLRVILRDVMSRATADKAAAGWDGDRYFVWHDESGLSSAVLASVWDSPEDARQAADAIAKLKNPPQAVSHRGDRMVAVWAGDDRKAAHALAGKVMRNIESVQVHTWEEWLKEAKITVSMSVRQLR